jgi:hypothetical protein
MFSKVSVLTIIAGICISIVATGCAPEADLSMNLTQNSTSTYKAVSELIATHRFEQPSVNKLEEKQAGSKIELEFKQQIESVDTKGNATAKITIIGIKYFAVGLKGVSFDFDSSRKADMKKPFAKLIGQSYTIQIAPDGSVKALNTKKASRVVKGGIDGKIAKALLSDSNLSRIHQILALPESAGIACRKGYSWTKLQKTHPRLKWAPKTFEKTYTVTGVENKGGHQIASITMTAGEDTGGEKTQSPLPGVFSNMLDPEESFTGQMVIDLDTGLVHKYSEKFVGTYTAVDPIAKKDPDIFTMGFTDTVTIERVN